MNIELTNKLHYNNTEPQLLTYLNSVPDKIFISETSGLCDVQPVEMLQDQAQCILGDYVRTRYPRQPTRFGRLLLLVPSLRAIRSLTVELLFFKETIGEIPITQLLGDMYYMEKCNTGQA